MDVCNESLGSSAVDLLSFVFMAIGVPLRSLEPCSSEPFPVCRIVRSSRQMRLPARVLDALLVIDICEFGFKVAGNSLLMVGRGSTSSPNF